MFGNGEIVLMDGAMGTQLRLAGMPDGACHEEWNLSRPEVVMSIHRAYVEAGAQVLLTNTFQANPVQLTRHRLLEKGPDIVRAGVRLARMAGARWVLGSIGPINTPRDFTEQTTLQTLASWFEGVDGLLLETCSDASVFDAARWLSECAMPIFLSLTYRHDPRRGIGTRDGMLPEDVARKATNVAALGVNCGQEQDLEHLAEVLRRYRRVNATLPLFARPNAGTPANVNGTWVYPRRAEDMDVHKLIQAGATMIGGCCGTTPEHISCWSRSLRDVTYPSQPPGRLPGSGVVS